mgnify:CR=1 FL=1
MKAVFFLVTSLAFCACGTSEYRLLQQRSLAQQQPGDLAQIPHLQSKGRVQDKDYNQIEIIDRLVAMQTQAIPFLIDKLTDETQINRPVIDFWSEVAVGDVALIILTDLFTDQSWTNTTIPNVSWDAMLERKTQNISSEELLRQYIRQHGRKAIQQKWTKIWDAYRDKLYWDEKDRCFKTRT